MADMLEIDLDALEGALGELDELLTEQVGNAETLLENLNGLRRVLADIREGLEG